jgi:Zn-dependent protease/predicted transcriptional regulator
MAPTIRLGKVFGIEISANWSLALIFALIAWTLGTDVLPSIAPGQPALDYWIAAALGTAGFYVCLVAHELSHSLVSRRKGIQVSGITLWLFGGVSNLAGEPSTPGDEALIAVVGPLTSFVLAAVSLVIAAVTQPWPLVEAVFGWLTFINIALGVFNLVPAFPLDGGRLLSSLFWWRQGSRRRGVHSAVRIGRVLSYVMIGIGVLVLFTGGGTSGVINGVWLALLGWFLLSAGRSEETGTAIKASLRSVPVSAAMSSPVVTIPDWISVRQFLESIAPAHPFATYPVHDPSGRLTGIVRLNDLVRVGAPGGGDVRLNTVARPMAEVPITRPDEDLAVLIERAGPRLENRALVYDNGTLVGIVSPVDIARLLTARQAPRPS